jgi:hypothetical protein
MLVMVNTQIRSSLIVGITLFFSAVSAPPSDAQFRPDQSCVVTGQTHDCAGTLFQARSDSQADAQTLPLVTIEGDWRSDKLQVPWSEPVLVKDPFDGNQVAVFDRDFSGSVGLGGSESGVITKWTFNRVSVFAYRKTNVCGFLTCRKDVTPTPLGKQLELKIGEQVFRLEGEDGVFSVSEEVAKALQKAPTGQALMRVSVTGSGLSITSRIGDKTVQAWRRVYQAPTSQKS